MTENKSRAGFRYFECDACSFVWEQPSRDCFSPSVETCPHCGIDNQPVGFKQDNLVQVDKWGNLV